MQFRYNLIIHKDRSSKKIKVSVYKLIIKKREIWKDYDQNEMMKPVKTIKNIVNEQFLFPFLYICNSQTSLATMDLMQPSGLTVGVNFVKLLEE